MNVRKTEVLLPEGGEDGVSPGSMGFWVTSAAPSNWLGRTIPCQGTLVGSGKLFVTLMRTLPPSVTRRCGPGTWWLKA